MLCWGDSSVLIDIYNERCMRILYIETFAAICLKRLQIFVDCILLSKNEKIYKETYDSIMPTICEIKYCGFT